MAAKPFRWRFNWLVFIILNQNLMIIISALSSILWVGGTHVEEAPDSLRRCQTTTTLRFPNNNSPHFAPNLRHIYSFNLSSQILRLSGLPAPRHSLGMTPCEDQKTPKEGDMDQERSKKVSKRRGGRTIKLWGWSGDHRGCAVCRNKAEPSVWLAPLTSSRFPRRRYKASLGGYEPDFPYCHHHLCIVTIIIAASLSSISINSITQGMIQSTPSTSFATLISLITAPSHHRLSLMVIIVYPSNDHRH